MVWENDYPHQELLEVQFDKAFWGGISWQHRPKLEIHTLSNRAVTLLEGYPTLKHALFSKVYVQYPSQQHVHPTKKQTLRTT